MFAIQLSELIGQTPFIRWMAPMNPATAMFAWMALKRALPATVREVTEGAGFNIAFGIFFILTTLALWNTG